MPNYFPDGVTILPGESKQDQRAEQFDKLPVDEKLNYAYNALSIDTYRDLFEEFEDDSKIWHAIENSNNKELYNIVLRWYLSSWED